MSDPNRNQSPDASSSQGRHNYPPDYYCQPEDEINLLDLFLVLLKRKKMIMGIVGIAAIAAVVISLLLPNIYRSEATIMPQADTGQQGGGLPSALGGLSGLAGGILGIGGDSDLAQLEVALKSRELAHRVITKHELMPKLFADDWNAAKKTWTTDEPPTEQDAYRLIRDNLLSISADDKKGTLTVGFNHEDPSFAKQMVEWYLAELSEMLRQATIGDAREKARFVREELSKTSDALLREKLYTLLANEIEKETFAQARKYYDFEVIDPPVVPDLDKKVKPKRSLICILAVFAAFFVAIFLAFLAEFFTNLPDNADESQREALARYLPGSLGERFRDGKKSQ